MWANVDYKPGGYLHGVGWVRVLRARLGAGSKLLGLLEAGPNNKEGGPLLVVGVSSSSSLMILFLGTWACKRQTLHGGTWNI
jgi:hypothetical protein